MYPRILSALLFFSLLIPGCGGLQLNRPLTPQPGDWPVFAGSASRANASDVTITPPLTLDWSEDVGGGIGHGSPLIIDSILLIGNLEGELYAFHCPTGKEVGSVTLGEAINGSPLVSMSVAYVALSYSKETLIAYDLLEGRPRWRRMYGDIETTPLLYEGRIYVANSWGSLLCVDPREGDLVWQFDLTGNRAMKGIRSSPAAGGGLVVFGADDGAVYALDLQTGQQRWRTETNAAVAAPPSIADGKVFVGNLNGMLHAIDLESGQIRWTHNAGAPTFSNALLVREYAVFCTLGGSVLALRTSDGSIAWETDIGSPMNSGPVAAGEYLYVGTLKKELCGLRVSNGEFVWKTALSGRVKTAPAVAYRRLFVATDDRTVMAFSGSGI
jgi:outer membrane protein assembly factor BamB